MVRDVTGCYTYISEIEEWKLYTQTTQWIKERGFNELQTRAIKTFTDILLNWRKWTKCPFLLHIIRWPTLTLRMQKINWVMKDPFGKHLSWLPMGDRLCTHFIQIWAGNVTRPQLRLKRWHTPFDELWMRNLIGLRVMANLSSRILLSACKTWQRILWIRIRL